MPKTKTPKSLPSRVKIHDTTLALDDFFKVEKVSLSHEGFDGEMRGPMNRLNLERGDSVAALLHDKKNQSIILVRQFRYPAFKKTKKTTKGWILETVAGMIDKGEDPEKALRREIGEEVGYQLSKRPQPKLISTFFTSPGGTSERIFLYYCCVKDTDRKSDGGGMASEHEDVQLVTVPEKEFFVALKSGEYVDAKIMIGGFWLLNQLTIGAKSASKKPKPPSQPKESKATRKRSRK